MAQHANSCASIPIFQFPSQLRQIPIQYVIALFVLHFSTPPLTLTLLLCPSVPYPVPNILAH